MASLKVPSVQHLARNWQEEPIQIKRRLVTLVQNPPIFSYVQLYNLVHDLLVYGQPYDEIEKGVKQNVRRENVRKNFLSILPLIRDHFDGIRPDFVQSIGKRYYPIGRGLEIPFNPPLIYGVDGQLILPWMIFWRVNPLSKKQLSLFVTLVAEMLQQNPDLEDAKVEILDFSSPKQKLPRELKITDVRDVPVVTREELTRMLETFVDGYLLAKTELEAAPKAKSEEKPPRKDGDSDQPNLFD